VRKMLRIRQRRSGKGVVKKATSFLKRRTKLVGDAIKRQERDLERPGRSFLKGEKKKLRRIWKRARKKQIRPRIPF